MRSNVWGNCCLLSVGLLPATAMGITTMAQTPISPDTTSIKKMQEITVEWSPVSLYSAVSTTTPVQSIDRCAMQQWGLQQVSDALKKMSGISVKDYGGLGGMKTVSIRDLGAAHTAICYDGIPISNCQSGQIDLSRFNLDQVEELRLSIGQSDDLLMPAQLLGQSGLLNIKTLGATESPASKHPEITMKLSAGSWQTDNASVRIAQRLNPRHSVSVYADYRHTDGDYPFTLTNGQMQTRERRNNGEVDATTAEVNWHAQWDDRQTSDTKAYHYSTRQNLPGCVTLYNPTAHEQLWEETFFVQSRYQNHFNERWQGVAGIKYNHAWNRYRDRNVSYTDGVQTDIYRQDEFYGQVSLLYRATSRLTVAVAHDEQWNTLRSNLPACVYPLRHTTFSSLRLQYKDARLTMQAAVLHTATHEMQQHHRPGKTQETSSPTATDPLGHDQKKWTPSVTLSWQPMLHRIFYIRAFYKKAFRLPTFNDLYYYRIGNKSLRPELADEYNLGLTFRHGALSMTADLYHNEVTDQLVAFPTTFAWKMANFGRVRMEGVNLNVGYDLKLTPRSALQLSALYNYAKTVDRTTRGSHTYNNQIPYTARHSGSGMALLSLPWVEFGYTLLRTGERYSMAQRSPRYRLKPFTEHSLTCSHTFLLGQQSLICSASVQNLTNAQYEIIQYYPMPGRQWHIDLCWKW